MRLARGYLQASQTLRRAHHRGYYVLVDCALHVRRSLLHSVAHDSIDGFLHRVVYERLLTTSGNRYGSVTISFRTNLERQGI